MSEMQLKLADTFLKLGEIGLETGTSVVLRRCGLLVIFHKVHCILCYL